MLPEPSSEPISVGFAIWTGTGEKVAEYRGGGGEAVRAGVP